MPDRFVQQDAGPSRPEHDGHRPRGRRAGAHVEQRLVDCLRRIVLQQRFREVAIVEPPASSGHALLAAAVVLDDHVQRKPHQRAYIGRDQPVATGNEDRFVLAGERGDHLGDARIARACDPLQPLQQRNLGAIGKRHDRIAGQVERSSVADALERGNCTLALSGDRLGRARGLREGLEADVIRVGEGGFLTGYRAHTDAAVDRERPRLDDALLQAPRLDPGVLKVQIRVVDAVAVDIGEHPRELVELERRGREQQLRGLIEKRGVEDGNGEVSHGCPLLPGQHRKLVSWW